MRRETHKKYPVDEVDRRVGVGGGRIVARLDPTRAGRRGTRSRLKKKKKEEELAADKKKKNEGAAAPAARPGNDGGAFKAGGKAAEAHNRRGCTIVATKRPRT